MAKLSKTAQLVKKAVALVRTDRNISTQAFALMQEVIAMHHESGMSPHCINAVMGVLVDMPVIYKAAQKMVKDNTCLVFNSELKSLNLEQIKNRVFERDIKIDQYQMKVASATAKQIARVNNTRLQNMAIMDIRKYEIGGDQAASLLTQLRTERNKLGDNFFIIDEKIAANKEAYLVFVDLKPQLMTELKELKALPKKSESDYKKITELTKQIKELTQKITDIKEDNISLDKAQDRINEQIGKLRPRIKELYSQTVDGNVDTTKTDAQTLADLEKQQANALKSLVKKQNDLNLELIKQGKDPIEKISSSVNEVTKLREDLKLREEILSNKFDIIEELRAENAKLLQCSLDMIEAQEIANEKQATQDQLLNAIFDVVVTDSKSKAAKNIINLLMA